MKIIIQWTEGRNNRQTETEIPKGLSWEETCKYCIEALKDAYKFSDETLPNGITEIEL